MSLPMKWYCSNRVVWPVDEERVVLELTPASAQCRVGVGIEPRVTNEQDLPLEQGPMEFGEGFVIEVDEIDADDFRSDRRALGPKLEASERLVHPPGGHPRGDVRPEAQLRTER